MTERVSSGGAAPNTSPVSRGTSVGERSHSTNAATPACATSVTQLRWSAGSARNQASVSSIWATAWVARAPEACSIRRIVCSDAAAVMPVEPPRQCGHRHPAVVEGGKLGATVVGTE